MASEELNNFLIKAIKNRDLSTVIEALDAGADVNAESGGMKRRPLHYAVHDESGLILKELLKRNAKTDVFDDGGFTPLHEAVAVGQFINAEFLLESGADINVQEGNLVTPLHTAYFQDMRSETSLRVGFLLANGADQNKTMVWGGSKKTVLEIAEETRNPHAERLAEMLRRAPRQPVKPVTGKKTNDPAEGTVFKDAVAEEQARLRDLARRNKSRFQLKK